MNRAAVEALDAQIADLKGQRDIVIARMQENCEHDILETPYMEGFSVAIPPRRVCKTCGLAEEGWHCGYWKLKTRERVPQITREQAATYTLTFYTQEQLSEIRFG